MLSRSNRIPSLDIPLVMKRGIRVQGRGFALIYRKRQQEPSRFAFVVSTKVDKRATVRNRMRRILSESVRLHMHALPFAMDGILLGSKEMKDVSQEAAHAAVSQLFSTIL
jgi:ribonuclease P protein component